jgi:hypothetical protein
MKQDISDRLSRTSKQYKVPMDLLLLTKTFLPKPHTNESIHAAVLQYEHDPSAVVQVYGTISEWDISQVTDM